MCLADNRTMDILKTFTIDCIIRKEFNVTFNNSDLFTMTNLETIIDK
jgi:hypothetical protein